MWQDGVQQPGGATSIWEGHKFVGGAFPILVTKIFLLVQFFFSLKSFQILKKKHPIFNFPYFSKFQFFV